MKYQTPCIRKLIPYIQHIISVIVEDEITVYAAQASFFAIISAVPFISLLVSAVGVFVPADLNGFFTGISLPESLAAIVGTVLNDLHTAPNVSLLSVSAAVTLWTASKGIDAMRTGLETVYCAKSSHGFVMQKLRSLINTIFFIVLIIALIILLLFGSFITKLIRISQITTLVIKLRFPAAFVFMCAVFCISYSATAKRGKAVPSGIINHLPGAVFSSVGWILFSYFYSLYITYFPRASYIYGSLAAICLILLWIYFCTIILLLGAEINKLLYSYRTNKISGNTKTN